MPVHRCSFDDLETKVAAIEASGERIISVVAPTDSVCVIVTYDGSKRGNAKGVERR